MNFPIFLHRTLAVLLLVCPAMLSVAGDATGSRPVSPSIGMLWSTAPGEGSKIDKWSRYGLIVTSPDELGFEWEHKKFENQAEKFVPETIASGRKFLADLHAKAPGSLVLCELYFFEADEGAYPPDSPWWFHDAKGEKVQFWKGCHNMNLGNPDYIEHVVRRIGAVVAATEGKVGIFLDCLGFDPESKGGWMALLTKVRERCGDVPILVNTGWDSDDLDWIAPMVNGFMYEDSIKHTVDKNAEEFYARIHRQHQLCREPRLGINEVFSKSGDVGTAERELCRTLVYTNLSFLSSTSTYGHKHQWRPEWNAPLGPAVTPPAAPGPGRLARRDFVGGIVLWLPEDATTAENVKLDVPHHQVGREESLHKITVPPGTGVLLLNDTAR